MTFDKDKHMNKLYASLKQKDTFNTAFKKAFETSVYDIILDEKYPNLHLNKLTKLINLYASEIISITETVIDKDENFPDYRLKRELDSMSQLVIKIEKGELNTPLSQHLFNNTKELIVKFFPKIMDLSKYGFLLLEQYALMIHYDFITPFKSLVKHNP
jgi:hypothetical protein